MFFANEIGNALFAMDRRLPADRLARWVGSVRKAADFLIANGDVAWYANGNIALGNAETMELAWIATGDARYRTQYDAAITFALSPPADRWPGRGLVLTKAPTRADGADGRGYLTEESAGNVGYDPAYTMLQLDVATRLWLRTREQRELRLVNLLANQLLERVDGAWNLDVSGGTRTPAGTWPFTTPALIVMAGRGARPDLAARAQSQWKRIEQETRAAMVNGQHGAYRYIGTQLAVALEGLGTPLVPTALPLAGPRTAALARATVARQVSRRTRATRQHGRAKQRHRAARRTARASTRR
jgi:hypothetical protein